MAKDLRHFPGIVQAGTRIWVFGEGMAADWGVISLLMLICSSQASHQIWMASYHSGKKSLVLNRSSQQFTEMLGEGC